MRIARHCEQAVVTLGLALALLLDLKKSYGIATNLPAGVGVLELWRRTLPSGPGSPAYSAPSIVACSIAAGILATDMCDRATWLRS